MRCFRLICCAAIAAILVGCGIANPCDTRVDYKNAAETGLIRVPEGFDGLPPEVRVDIPTASTPPDVDQRCLESPPRYSPEREGDGDEG